MTNNEQNKINFLQSVVLGELAMHLKMFDLLNVKNQAAEIRKQFGEKNAEQMISSFNITAPDEVFKIFSMLFECADWQSTKEGNKYTIITKSCKFVGICKYLETSHPCDMYCLKQMFQIVQHMDPKAQITTKETLYDGQNKCKIKIISSR